MSVLTAAQLFSELTEGTRPLPGWLTGQENMHMGATGWPTEEWAHQRSRRMLPGSGACLPCRLADCQAEYRHTVSFTRRSVCS